MIIFQFMSGILRLSAVAVMLALAAASCTPNKQILESANANSPVSNTASAPAAGERPVDTVEQDIQAMRNADFNYIFLFRRKDDGAMDADDKKFFNAHTPPETNRRRLSDEGRAVIIGSNYRWDPETFKLFTERFNLEDYSKPENEIIDSGANTKGNSANKATH